MNTRKLIKYSLGGALVFIITLIILGSPVTTRTISDSFSVVAICYIIFGLSRLVSKIGLFNSFVFGTKQLIDIITNRKTIEGTNGVSFEQYVEGKKVISNYKECIFMFVISCLLSLTIALL